MANVIIRSEETERQTERIMEQFGHAGDESYREAAYATARIQEEAIAHAESESRKKYFC